MRRPASLADVEDSVNRTVNGLLRRAGWRPVVVPHVSYASTDVVRVLGRVLLARDPGQAGPAPGRRRGWRNFLTAELADVPLVADVGGQRHELRTDRGGHVDVRLPNPGLPPGRASVRVWLAEHEDVAADIPVVVVPADQRLGLVSDIDDTVIMTALPRPLVAAYHTFVLHAEAREPVAHMPELYERLLAHHPGAPTFYLSTGAWNTQATLRGFLDRHGYPEGPLLMTDWGPTATRFFRSGSEHKRRCLRGLVEDFPGIRWVLVGDDGQHDPQLYAEFARTHPTHVRLIAIRQLQPNLTGRQEDDRAQALVPEEIPEVRGRDGRELLDAIERQAGDMLT